jgi:hypothetical protein
VHDWVHMLRSWTLVDLMSPALLQRIYDAEPKSTEPNKFTAAELITTFRDMIWAELDQPTTKDLTDASPYVSSLRRGLQRDYLNLMLAQARARPGAYMSPELNGMQRYALRELSVKLGQVLYGAQISEADAARKLPTQADNLDFASRAHLLECKSRIDRALEAQFTDR